MSACLSSKDPDGPHFRHSHYLFFWQLLSKPLHYCPPSVVSQMQVMNKLMMHHSSLVVSKKKQLQRIGQKEQLVETQVAHRVDRRLGTQPWNGTGTNRNWSSVGPESHWWVCSKCSLLMMPCSLQESQSHGNSLPVWDPTSHVALPKKKHQTQNLRRVWVAWPALCSHLLAVGESPDSLSHPECTLERGLTPQTKAGVLFPIKGKRMLAIKKTNN